MWTADVDSLVGCSQGGGRAVNGSEQRVQGDSA